MKTPFKNILQPLSTDEFNALKADIKRHGVLNPIIVDDCGQILDGHHRYKIDKKAPQKVLAGLTDAAKKAFVISSNSKRRNLSPEQKAELRAAMIEIAHELAEEGQTQQQIAVQLGVPRPTVAGWFISNVDPNKANTPDQRVSVPKDAKPMIIDRIDAGESQANIAADFGISQGRVSQIYTQEKKRAENKAKQDAITAKEVDLTFSQLYDVVVIDPPWDMQKIDRDCAPNQSEFDYPTMTQDELSEMVLPFKSDCHVWVWTTHRFLPDAMELLEAWGLKYVCLFVWHKPGGFQPFGLPQYNCEFAVYARKGSPQFIDTKAFNVCFNAPRGDHSEKPEEFYEVLRRVTDGDRIDIFNRRDIEGFDGWGNEA